MGMSTPLPAEAALYSFSTHTFTPCSTTGNSGPTLAACQSSYSATTWKSDTSLFNVTSGIQLWTVPATGTYRITVAGGSGGAGVQAGGKGATISGEFNFTQGTILKILVGQSGASFASASGGGGGGTFVVSNSNTPIIIAGGGGGGGGNANSTHAGRDASYTTSGTASNSGGAGGTATAGGTGSSTLYGGGGGGSAASGVNGGSQTGGGGGLGASGGAGFGGDGGPGQNVFVISKSFLNGGAGGYRTAHGTISNSFGGFGGGGNGTGITYVSGGGGGGGYSGGGGGNGLNNGGGGGGGGSYNSGNNPQNINLTNNGAGFATFLLLNSDTTPPSVTSPTTFNVNENSTAITTLTASETATWFIFSGVDSLTVAVDSSTGVLSFKIGQNYEAPSDSDSNRIYQFTIRIVDVAGNETTTPFSVTILDVNEAPAISSNGGGSTSSISLAENSTAVTTVLAVDPDTGTTLAYSISGTDSSDFLIGSTTGVLTFISAPNFEAPLDSDANNVYSVIVSVSDGALTDDQTLTITVTNVVEPAGILGIAFSTPPTKGRSTTVTIQLDSAGKATLMVSGKRVPGCINKNTTGVTPASLTCSWKPALSGAARVSVYINPSAGTSTSATVEAGIIQVGRRATTR